MPSNDIGRGNILYDQVLSITITPASVATITTAEQDFTVQGLQVNDHVDVRCNVAQVAGVAIAGARVKSANVLTIQWVNPTAGPVVPPPGVYLVNVNRPLIGTNAAIVGNML